MNQRKCASCGEWVDESLEICTKCNSAFYAKEKEQQEEDKKRASSSVEIPLIKIHESDSLLIRIFKKIIRFHQMVFIFFVTIISYIAASIVG